MNEFKVKGIIHCHSDLSYDGQNTLEELCIEFKKQGFSFVALTEHSLGITDETYENFVKKCKQLSSKNFIVLPGLEILCPDGSEIAGVGLEEIVLPGEAEEVIEQVKAKGGFSVWVHPQKRIKLPQTPFSSNAIEILNGKEDGTISPVLSLFRKISAWEKKYNFHMIVGLDLHYLGEPLNVWTECFVRILSQKEILTSLKRGRFLNKISGRSIPSSGKIPIADKVSFIVLRIAYLVWNWVLDILPKPIFDMVIKSSRYFVNKFKK